MTVSLVFGVNGQVGSYLAEQLLDVGHHVIGTVRHSSTGASLARIAGLPAAAARHDPDPRSRRWRRLEADLGDVGSVEAAIAAAVGLAEEIGHRSLRVFNMADQDHVGHSFAAPAVSLAVTVGGCAAILAAAERIDGGRFDIRVWQPLSATMFGPAPAPQTLDTPLDPRSPYAAAKAHAWFLCRMARARGLRVSCGVCCNHDSPRRGDDFLLQRICKAVASGGQLVYSGDLGHRVDVGDARDYAAAARLALDPPPTGERDIGARDWALGTGVAPTVAEMILAAEAAVGAEPHRGCEIVPGAGNRAVADSAICSYRIDPAEAESALGWKPRKDLGALVRWVMTKWPITTDRKGAGRC